MANSRRPSTKTPRPVCAAAKHIGLRVPIQISDRLEAIARREHNGVSAVVRRLLTAALAANGDEAA